MTVVSSSTDQPRVQPGEPAEHAEAPRRPDRPAKVASILVGVVVAAGIVLRFWPAGPLWLDEAISVDLARLPLGDLDAALRHDGHPPLYYVLLHGWMWAFGSGDLAVRSLAGAISVATLPMAWAAGDRLGGRRTAAVAVVLVASSPFAIRYATETRMYSLLTFVALAGYLAVVRALASPRPARLALVALTAAAGLYTHYWALWLVAAGAAVVASLALRRPALRPAGIRVIGAMAVGGLTFVPWLPVLAYQGAHTGTPWARSVEPFDAGFDTLLDFGGGKWAGGRVLGPVLAALVLLALVARPIDRWRMEFDLRTVPGVRPLLALAAGAMALGLGAAVVTASAFQPRYAAGIFPFFLQAAAVGLWRLPHPRARWGVLALVVVAGFGGAIRANTMPRTQAGELASALERQAQPGDLLVFCPDQLRPAVQRELDLGGGPALRAVTYPSGSPSHRVDWVDYADRIAAEAPDQFAQRVVRLAGPGASIWLIEADTYRSFGSDCEDIRAAITTARGVPESVVDRSDNAYERAALRRFPAR